jgi:hypothetical protein
MLGDKDAEFTAAHQMANILKILLDPESIIAVLAIYHHCWIVKNNVYFLLEGRKG